jgi:hypothetical protein
VTPRPGSPLASALDRGWLALAALSLLAGTACVPGVATPTPAAPVRPAVTVQAPSQSTSLSTPPPGAYPAPGASSTVTGNSGVAGGYPAPGPGVTPISRPAPPDKAYP